MKKWIIGILATIFTLLIIIVVGGFWFFRQAFGPLERTIEIPLTDSKTLVCNEVYNADFAAVFYDVDFKLNDKGKIINLGQATFQNDQWDKLVKLDSIHNCYILSFYKDSYLRLLIHNRVTTLNVDTTLLPLYLKRDKTWRSDNREIEMRRITSVNSKLEEAQSTFLKVNFEFLIEDSIRFRQSIIYELDSLTGRLKTKEFLGKEQIKD